MARVARLAGALVVETQGEYFLVGETKMPCDWEAAGFHRPEERDAKERPFVRLAARTGVALEEPFLDVGVEGEDLARLLVRLFLIERNGSVSERLWRLVVRRGEPDSEEPVDGTVAARWLGEIPFPIWNVVRDAVLRCL